MAQATRAFGIGVLIVATVISWIPMLMLVLSIGIASALGCRLDEASVHPGAAGMDLGPALSDGFMSGWLLLVVWPVMLISQVAWIVLLVRMLRRKYRARAAQEL